jgi:hypothetical protein
MGFEPMIRVLQDPMQATCGALARLSSDSVLRVCCFWVAWRTETLPSSGTWQRTVTRVSDSKGRLHHWGQRIKVRSHWLHPWIAPYCIPPAMKVPF